MYAEKPKLHQRQKTYIQGSLRTIALDVTPRCNLHCSHCYAETFAGVKPIALDILVKTLDELYDLGVLHYVLQGGEPIEDPDRLETIILGIHPDETYINVVSNGWRMTRDKVRWLKGLKVDKIAFSLDSGIPEEHDQNRRQGSFEHVMENMEYVLEEGLLTSISTVVTHQSLYSEGFKKAYEFAGQKGIRIDTQIAMPAGKWDGKKEFLVTPEDARYIKQLQIEGPVLANGQRMVNRDIFSGIFDHCPAGTEFMAITTDGNVLPCNFLQFSLGSIAEKSFAKMRKDLLTSDWFTGKYTMCIGGENMEFVDQYIMPYVNVKKPLDAYEIFQLKERLNCGQ
jgi:MoaA/NifB/PqqE/SkfB family radical SAM enzyme